MLNFISLFCEEAEKVDGKTLPLLFRHQLRKCNKSRRNLAFYVIDPRKREMRFCFRFSSPFRLNDGEEEL